MPSTRNNPLSRLLTFIILLPIHFYRHCISPHFPPSCRFTPTCSEYAIQAIHRYGICRGLILAIRRLLRCHPFTPGGYDPLP
ncbi:MAG: membrane protein insertion efficiency factor YidD [Tannerellaceae bacterium]|nr:membrane protein insertion efficiency factor YidD [Tannerellaceae bacterium]